LGTRAIAWVTDDRYRVQTVNLSDRNAAMVARADLTDPYLLIGLASVRDRDDGGMRT
jgi:hypothetical protein